MKKHNNWPIGVCSWSLQTDINGIAEIMNKLELEHIHLALAPALEDGGKEYLEAVKNQGWTVTSGMIAYAGEDYTTLETIKKTGGIVPDEQWEQNCELTIKAMDAARGLDTEYLSMHAGFLDHSDPEYAGKFYDRITCLADAAAKRDIMLLLETGQESAEELQQFMEELNHPALGINFDPANMILYDKGDPYEAVRTLAPWIKHVHIKDATKTDKPGDWGSEVPWGAGQVGSEAFLDVLGEVGFAGSLAIEREAGDSRFEDIQKAVKSLTEHGK
jgi:sugar phosphate isomerase/epimerase